MKTHLECLPCTVNSYLRLAGTGVIPEEKQEELMRKLLRFLSEADYNYSPPEMGAELHRMIRKSLQNPDPYPEKIQQFLGVEMDVEQMSGVVDPALYRQRKA